jgi:hypothetical protein
VQILKADSVVSWAVYSSVVGGTLARVLRWLGLENGTEIQNPARIQKQLQLLLVAQLALIAAVEVIVFLFISEGAATAMLFIVLLLMAYQWFIYTVQRNKGIVLSDLFVRWHYAVVAAVLVVLLVRCAFLWASADYKFVEAKCDAATGNSSTTTVLAA